MNWTDKKDPLVNEEEGEKKEKEKIMIINFKQT